MKKIYKNSFIFLAIISFFVCFILEVLLRRSVLDCFLFLIKSPHIFILNAIIIAFTMSWGLFIKKRNAAFISVSLVWLGLGIGNFILTFFRLTPLCGSDFLIIKDALGIINLYLNTFQITLIISLIILVIIGIVFLFLKGKKFRCNYKISGIFTTLIAVLIISSFIFLPFKKDFADLQNAYNRYGFSYSFLNTVFDRGIDIPKGYSQEVFEELLDKINAVEDSNPKIKPDIIFVQLESFFDINNLKGITLSENPIPNFTRLKNEFSSGYLTVPTFGGQTANTEFEVLTGFDVNFFGAGECPFETSVNKIACESIATNLKDAGYKTHAIHNHTGTFYERHLVYPNLGFDTFTPIEYMNGIERNIMTWAKDKILLKYILQALNTTKEKDFVYTVSAQAHGNYPKIFVPESSKITVSGIEDKEESNKYTYYVNQLYESDQFVGELIKEIEKRNKPTVVVLYGDHLPAFKIKNKDLKNKNIYETEYVIWDNLGFKKEKKDLCSYHLSSHVLSLLNINSGDNNKLNMYYKDDKDYKLLSEALAYNVFKLQENRYLKRYEKADMQLGIIKPQIDEVFFSDGALVVTGRGFSPYSVIVIGNEKKHTGYIYENAIVAYDADEYEGEGKKALKVCQITQSGEILSQTDAYFNLLRK